ncbi:MAG: hypothetical protein NC084_09675 [Bacteroides sp.]|nr:hypothetical protein [Eubacterium sp.]MCM1419628.1 hypothetical protein [Roseburia sp.]MCM1462966.1 hypothetical protein [Bacteroides sp.]
MSETNIQAAINAVADRITALLDIPITPPPLLKDGGVVLYPEGGGIEAQSLDQSHARCYADVTVECKAREAAEGYRTASSIYERIRAPDFSGLFGGVQILSVRALSAPRLVSRTDDVVYAFSLRINYYF